MARAYRVIEVLREVNAWELGTLDYEGPANTRVRVKGGRALYESVWASANRSYKPVRLARLEPTADRRIKQVEQWVESYVILEVVQVEEVK